VNKLELASSPALRVMVSSPFLMMPSTTLLYRILDTIIIGVKRNRPAAWGWLLFPFEDFVADRDIGHLGRRPAQGHERLYGSG
jgi:hypothetical protein